jgi:hypothetical protein
MPMILQLEDSSLPKEAWTVVKAEARKSASNPGYSWVRYDGILPYLVQDEHLVHEDVFFKQCKSSPKQKKVDVGREGETVVNVLPITHLGGTKKVPRR